jgi:hypothetical protein
MRRTAITSVAGLFPFAFEADYLRVFMVLEGITDVMKLPNSDIMVLRRFV